MLVEGTSTSAPARAHSYRDDFREAGGFLVIIQLISTLDNQHSQTEPEVHAALQVEIFKLALSILSDSLVQHPLNIKAFEATVGWKSLSDAIEIATNSGIAADSIFGSLFGLAVADVQTYAGRITSTRRFLADRASAGDSARVTSEPAEAAQAQMLEGRVKDQWTPVPSIILPHAIRIMLELLFRSTTASKGVDMFAVDRQGVEIVLHILLRLVSTSRRNQIGLANIGLSTLILNSVLPSPPLNVSASMSESSSMTPTTSQTYRALSSSTLAADESFAEPTDPPNRDLLVKILRQLYAAAGIPDKDGRKLLTYLSTPSSLRSDTGLPSQDERDRVLDLLLDVADSSQQPNTVLFSMAEHGHASLAFSTLRRPFPPSASSRGFTFVTTFSIERIEPSRPIEVLTLFDAHRSLHVQLFVEPGTGLFCYSTSSLASSPPTRFNNVAFVTGKRYHLAFVHLHPRGGAHMSPAKLYVDGELIEEKLVPWPASSRGAPSTVTSASHLANPVRAVLGSPPGSSNDAYHGTQDSMPGQARNNRLVWSLGPTMLLDDAIPHDLPLILYELGPRYTGNAQDSLGRFLTYRASANINLRLDQVARKPSAATSAGGAPLSEKELSNLPLVTAIAGRASDLVPEERLYFVMNAANTAIFDRSGSGAGRGAASSSDPSKRSGSRVILNQAVPLNREAVGSSFGLAKMYGDPTLLIPQPLDEMIWKLGGCAILLKLIFDADTAGTLAKTLRLFLQLVSQSWRLSEDVERSKGYEVLGWHLHNKGHLFNEEIATILFDAVGVVGGDGSLLINPFLYRIVMLDFELWSKTSRDLQDRHLQHFTLLLRTSRHRRVSRNIVCFILRVVSYH